MPFSPNHDDMTRALAAQRGAHNPYNRQQPRDPSDLGDPPPAIFHRLMSVWRTGEAVSAIHADWRAQIESNGPFNARMRAEGLAGGLIVDGEEFLARADDSEGGGVTARDAQSGQFASVDEAMRDAQATPLPGGMVPQEAPPPPADPIRAAYWRAIDARAAQGNS